MHTNDNETPTVISNATTLRIFFPFSSLEDLVQALAEGDHDLGNEATQAAGALTQWAGNDCPWFNPGPTPIPVGLGITGLCY